MALTFLQATQDGTDTNVYTFASQNFGTASADRYIICTGAARTLAGTALSSITIGGVTATLNVNFVDSGVTCISFIGIAAVPSGTSGDVVLTFNGTMRRAGIGLYAVTNLTSTTPTDTGSSEANPLTAGGLDISAGGFGVAVGGTADTGASATWAGLTEDFDTAWAPADGSYSGSSQTYATQQTGLTVTCTWTASTVPVGAFASYGLGTTTKGNLSLLGVGT